MKHIATEKKHTLVLNEDEWYGLETILAGYNEAFAGMEFEDKESQRIAKRLFKLFDIDCLISDYSGDEW